MYGTSCVAKLPSNALLTETLLMKAPFDFSENRHIKSIVRPERVTEVRVHHCSFQPGYFTVNTDKEPITGSTTTNVLIDKIRINHYWSKDEDFFNNTKVPRRSKWQESQAVMFERVENCNQEIDGTILHFISSLRKMMGLF